MSLYEARIENNLKHHKISKFKFLHFRNSEVFTGQSPGWGLWLSSVAIMKGMNYLHQHKPNAIVHRDLTPRNVLQDEAGHLKVTDFGLSRIVQDKNIYGPYKMTGETGSCRKLLHYENYAIEIYSALIAIWLQRFFAENPMTRALTFSRLP
eukprot:Gb_14428 [translate_table: standard]